MARYSVQYNDHEKTSQGYAKEHMERFKTKDTALAYARKLAKDPNVTRVVLNKIEHDEMVPGFGMAIHTKIETIK